MTATGKKPLAQRFRRKLGAWRRVATRFNVQDEASAARLLARLARAARSNPAGDVLVIGENAFADAVCRHLSSLRVPVRRASQQAAADLDAAKLDGVACIVIGSLDSSAQLALGRALVGNAFAQHIPLEYVALPRRENAAMAVWDRYDNRDFISPLLGESGAAYYAIYQESLRRFAQKTDIRDFLDLCMLLRSLSARQTDGCVAEFGSFQGHSGYLMSRVIEHQGSDRRLFMFDMFENFPEEGAGVDRFWSGTHKVDFEVVRSKFADRPNVELVKGDFTQTLADVQTGPIALAFIDCDSWRATRYLLEEIWERRLIDGGLVVLEDYGHGALLGNRVAAHQFFDGRRDAFTYFSQFSGFLIALKLPGTAAPAAGGEVCS